MVTRAAVRVGMMALAGMLCGSTVWGQVTPAVGYTPPDDTPSLRVGFTLYPIFTVQTEPQITDAAGNTVQRNAFDIGRAYINLTGQVSHLLAFRVTPDITRESGLLTLAPGNSVPNDSLVFRIKYAYGQFNLDDWTARGTWVRLGIQPTPWVDFEEGIYRYRFQGTVFVERIPLPTAMTSSDAGVSFHYNFPRNYGEVHVGYYNGENYQRVETNNQKGFEFRGSLRPFAAGMPVLRGLRAHLVYYNDHYVSDSERKRLMGAVTYEQKYVNVGFDYLDADDQALPTVAKIPANGFSIWATPKKDFPDGSSWEALLRYDHWTPNTTDLLAPATTAPIFGTTLLSDQRQKRSIIGVAYWFPRQTGVQAALLLDYDAQSFDNITTPETKSVSIHGLLQF
jgi:hypothetical protein